MRCWQRNGMNQLARQKYSGVLWRAVYPPDIAAAFSAQPSAADLCSLAQTSACRCDGNAAKSTP